MTIYKSVASLALILMLAACNNSQKTDGAHAHDDITVPYTGYSETIEVFADVQPLAVGANSEIIVHFTDLETFKPLKAKEVLASLIVGSKGLRQISNEAVQDGIYKFVFQPVESGVGRLDFKLDIEGKERNVSISNVKVYADAHNAVHLAEELIPTSPNAIGFTKEQSWKVDFKTQMPAYMPFGNVIKSTAKVEASPLDKYIVAAKSSGFVSYASGIISEGREVQNKEWLMTISGYGLTENNAVVRMQEARVEYDIANADYNRDKRLFDQKIVSERQLLESQSRYEKAQTQWNNLQNTVDASGEKVMVKGKGFVNDIFVENGEYVEAGTPLFSIINTKRIVLKAMVRQIHRMDLAQLYDATIELDNGDVLTLSQLNGRILSVAQSLSDDNYLLPVTLEVDYNQQLISGGFANVYLKTISKQPVVVVPETAMVETQGLYFVYTQLTPELFERRQVMVGASDGQSRVITSGLNANERIVSRGATLVKLAAVSNTIDPHAGHVH